jgi:hypothetical protein
VFIPLSNSASKLAHPVDGLNALASFLWWIHD